MLYIRQWREWSQGNEGMDGEIHQLFKNPSADQEIADIMSLTKAYHNYKRDYVKHLSFNPHAENSS